MYKRQTIHIELVEEDLDGIERRINEKVDSVTCEDEATRDELPVILRLKDENDGERDVANFTMHGL